ncbi:acyl-ACP--UDP-N-acetylglucosamine O-acyltransferase [Oligella ureolytica]|nr:acyl-ACP--UDP-N-acetylglucosamine O-acyltransferase [Alcaligenaceae bacterium]HZJ98093.1 acyl-ACP--UDP-N-acetylglucosamine O-acyltransferase [Oligella sp.]
MANIHPTAIIHDGAQLHESVRVGAYSIIGPEVIMGEGSVVGEHCVISGRTIIGKNNTFYRFCSVGGAPQDKKYAGEDTALEIGDGNMFREFVTINTGTVQDSGTTRLGNNNWIMAYVHIAHDCQLGNEIVMSNGIQLAGHIHIGDWAIIGGLAAAHQFTNIGAHSMTGGMSAIRQDIPPYVLGAGQPYKPAGVNSEGLRRRGYSATQIQAIKEAYKYIYLRSLKIEDAVAAIRNLQKNSEKDIADVLEPFVDFFEKSSARGVGR